MPKSYMDGPLCYIIIRYLFYVTDEYVLQPQSEKNEDHPLNPNPDSQWQSFFKDNDVLLQIDKDVRRLCPDINFFSQATDFPNKKIAGLISFSSNFVTLKVEFFLSIFCKRMLYNHKFLIIYRRTIRTITSKSQPDCIKVSKSREKRIRHSKIISSQKEGNWNLCSLGQRTRSTLGGSAKNFVSLRQTQPWSKLCARNEWNYWTNLLCFCIWSK